MGPLGGGGDGALRRGKPGPDEIFSRALGKKAGPAAAVGGGGGGAPLSGGAAYSEGEGAGDGAMYGEYAEQAGREAAGAAGDEYGGGGYDSGAGKGPRSGEGCNKTVGAPPARSYFAVIFRGIHLRAKF